MVSVGDKEACVELIFQEAELLDARRFQEWLGLFAKDARYWVPLHEGQTDPEGELNIVYDDRNRLEDRVYRIESGYALAQDPPSRTARVISNLRVSSEAESDLLAVRSTFVIVEVRPGRQQVLGGHYTHHLRREDGGLKIVLKRVDLANSEEPLSNLTFIL
jgi:benzoate/toluate 1,2-dioxygenase beta subunit